MLGDALTELYFIGDLHGDAECARAWVQRTGAVDFGDAAGAVPSSGDGTSEPSPRPLNSSAWRWTGSEGTALVFLGDFVDKGPGRAPARYVRAHSHTRCRAEGLKLASC